MSTGQLVVRISWLFAALCLVIPTFSAELTSTQRAKTLKVAEAVKAARAAYQAGDYEASGKALETAMVAIDAAVAESDPVLYDAISPAFPMIAKASTLLELEGIVVRPFMVPERPAAGAAPATSSAAPKPTPAATTRVPSRPPARKPEPLPNMTPANPLAASVESISFTKTVAPILVQHCGRCHVSGARGNFSMVNFATLMKGPPEGVVIFPGDVIGSRLIETIETGDMPRGGKVPADQFKILKDWIAGGAKYDGASPDIPLTTFAGSAGVAPPPMPAPAAPVVKRSTGAETVSFAKDIAPILLKNCNGCHVDAMQTRGGLNMTTFTALMRGGDSGVAVQGGQGAMSLLVRKLKGEEGDRMPAGGRPPLSDEQITLISKWIDEGATLDGDNADQPLSVMSGLAWAKSATEEELSERRASEAMDHLKLAGNPAKLEDAITTDHFFVVGSAGAGTLKTVADAAEKAWTEVNAWIKTDATRGRITVFVLPKRYDYSEFSKMVEQRSIPGDWQSHWRYDGIDSYVAMVATSQDKDDAIKARLISPLASLAAAMRGPSVPRWFAEGVGRATAAKLAARDLPAVETWNRELLVALASMKDGTALVKNELSPEQSDLVAYGIASVMLSRNQRARYDKLVRAMPTSKSFDETFEQAFGSNVATYVTQVKQVGPAIVSARGR